MYMYNNHCHQVTAHLQLKILLLYLNNLLYSVTCFALRTANINMLTFCPFVMKLFVTPMSYPLLPSKRILEYATTDFPYTCWPQYTLRLHGLNSTDVFTHFHRNQYTLISFAM